MTARRKHIMDSISDMAAKFLYYNRKEDGDLPRGAIEEAVKCREVTVDEMVEEFRSSLEAGLSGSTG